MISAQAARSLPRAIGVWNISSIRTWLMKVTHPQAEITTRLKRDALAMGEDNLATRSK